MPKKIDEDVLFETVLKLWVERGYSGTTTKKIAERAHVNEATLFRRYGGKAKLVVTAISKKLQNVPLRTLTATDDVEADLRRIVESYQETNQQIGAVFPLLLAEVSRDAALRPALEVAWENLGFLVRIIGHHQARGALREESPLTTLTALIGPLFVIGMFGDAHPAKSMFDAEEHVRAFLHGRAPR
jgi:AcrR family transcriptional regulator